MYPIANRLDRLGRGVECPTCHTVYFLEGSKNRDRMYHQAGEDRTEHWKLLCICSEQISFQKQNVRRYRTHSAALESGYAIEGGWKLSAWDPWEQSKLSSAIAKSISEDLGLSVREFSQISAFLHVRRTKEKGRH